MTEAIDDYSKEIEQNEIVLKKSDKLRQQMKEIADQHAPKIVRPKQEPLYEKRG